MSGIERQSEYYAFTEAVQDRGEEHEASVELPDLAEVRDLLAGPRVTPGMLSS